MGFNTRMTGIYCITNLQNGKFYIGSAVDFSNRVSKHKSFLRRNIHANAHLQSAWNKYGEENFKFELLDEVKRENLLEMEQRYIDVLEPEYNIAKSTTAPNLGRILSPEWKEHLHNSLVNPSIEKRKEFGNPGEKHPFFGKHLTEEHRKKISIARKLYFQNKKLKEIQHAIDGKTK